MDTIMGFFLFSSVLSNSFKLQFINIGTLEKSIKRFSRNPSTWYLLGGVHQEKKALQIIEILHRRPLNYCDEFASR